MLNTRAYKLIANEQNEMIGLQAMDKDGKLINIKASSVILATEETLWLIRKCYKDILGLMLIGPGIVSAVTPLKPLVEDPVEYEEMIAEEPDTLTRSNIGRLMPPMWVENTPGFQPMVDAIIAEGGGVVIADIWKN